MATNTYVALRTETVAVATGTVTFDLTGISGYTDLVIVINGVGATGTTFPWMRFNGLSTNIYSDSALYGNGTSADSNRRTANSRGYLAENVQLPITQIGNILVNIMNYSNSTTYKTWLVRNNNQETGTYTGVEAIVGLAQLTDAITSITIGTASGGTDYNFAAGSTFSLYGIKVWADETSPKATGGYVYEDSSYWYHEFPFSSTFTPNQSLTADYLVVAGGGGGGGLYRGGGGGAGGLRCTVTATGGGGSLESALSLTASTNYTVTVGAGGAGDQYNNGNNGNDSVFSTITSNKGGGGGKYQTNANSGTFGAGGGGGGDDGSSGTGANGTANQGFAGGAGSSSGAAQCGGGGGGAGALGQAGGSGGTDGDGGAGVSTSITGSLVTYAGGGGGGNYGGGNVTIGGAGGGGAGGSGSSPYQNGTAGTANTGGGGGGSSGQESYAGTGGNGGSGIVIVRYAK